MEIVMFSANGISFRKEDHLIHVTSEPVERTISLHTGEGDNLISFLGDVDHPIVYLNHRVIYHPEKGPLVETVIKGTTFHQWIGGKEKDVIMEIMENDIMTRELYTYPNGNQWKKITSSNGTVVTKTIFR